MATELERAVQAVQIASDPTQAPVHQQALEYLSTFQQNAAETWRLALAIFVESSSDGSRKHPQQARFFGLRVLDDFLDNRVDPLDEDSFRTLQQTLLGYIQSEYVLGPAEASSPFLRNKFSHTLSLLFLCTYLEQWPTFFMDLFALISPAESSSQATFNAHVSLLFFHVVLEISGEVADQMIKSARTWTEVRHRRDALVRDAMRDRDAAKINEAVVTIVANNMERMVRLRSGDVTATSEREQDSVTEVVDWGVRTFGSYVGWIDVSLTVTQATVPMLFTLLSDESLPIRLATSRTLLRIVAKGLKEPGDKLQLIKVLSLGQVIDALESKTRAEQIARGKVVDEGEESYREALGNLLNILGLELTKLVDECPADNVRDEAVRLQHQILPVMLRFMADEYDDTSSTVFQFLHGVLGSYKRMRKLSAEPIDGNKRAFLASLLGVILEKMKWEREDDPDDMDEDDRTAFDGLRKDLRTFLDAVLMIDQDLVTSAVQTLAIDTMKAFQSGVSLEWQQAELAVYLVYIFGEINKSGGKGRAAFCLPPAIPREQRKEVDYSSYPLTTHGEMLYALVQSGISAYPHKAVVMQFFETVARYGDFFKVRKECVLPTLEAMVDSRGLHNGDSTIQSRVFYLFYRFIRDCRHEITPDITLTLVEGMRDLLLPKIDLPELESPEEQDMLTEAAKNPGAFDAQLYVFETAGLLVSLFFKTPGEQSALLLSVVQPLLDQLAHALQTPMKGAQDVMPILEVHHVIMALGNIAKGFPDYPSPVPEGYIMPPLDVFQQVANAILVSLDAMNIIKVVRDATRFAFARIIATTGPSIMHLIPQLMASLLAHFEPSELVDFMNFIGLLVHKLQGDMFDVLDQLIGPLSTRIFELLQQPVTGTDDHFTYVDTKKSYLTLLNNILAAKLHGIFTSGRNKDRLEPLLESMQQLTEDISDPASQKAAFTFLGRGVAVWALPMQAVPPNGGAVATSSQGLPGFERFIYERLVPSAFKVLASPQFNVKDGQMLVVLHEIANFLQTVIKTRGQDAYDFFVNSFLPSQGWPPEAAIEFTDKLRDLDIKAFRKWFADMARASRT